MSDNTKILKKFNSQNINIMENELSVHKIAIENKFLWEETTRLYHLLIPRRLTQSRPPVDSSGGVVIYRTAPPLRLAGILSTTFVFAHQRFIVASSPPREVGLCSPLASRNLLVLLDLLEHGGL